MLVDRCGHCKSGEAVYVGYRWLHGYLGSPDSEVAYDWVCTSCRAVHVSYDKPASPSLRTPLQRWPEQSPIIPLARCPSCHSCLVERSGADHRCAFCGHRYRQESG